MLVFLSLIYKSFFKLLYSKMCIKAFEGKFTNAALSIIIFLLHKPLNYLAKDNLRPPVLALSIPQAKIKLSTATRL